MTANEAHTGIEIPAVPSGTAVVKKPSESTTKNIILSKIRALCQDFFESNVMVAIMSLFTIWSLFSDDIRTTSVGPEGDEGFDIVISIAFFFFLSEIVAGCFYKADYLYIPDMKRLPGEDFAASISRRIQIGSFYFWLDIIATLSLLFEMSWALDGASLGSSQTTKAGTASRAGARAGRIIRLVRMVRLIRMVKLYKYATAAVGLSAQNANASLSKKKVDSNSNDNEEEEEEALPESRVGAAMSDLTNRRVIVLVLTMLIIVPLLTVTDSDMSQVLSVQLVHRMAVLNATCSQNYSEGLQIALQETIDNTNIVGIKLDDFWYYKDTDTLNGLRKSERIEFYESSNGFNTLMIFNNRASTVNSSMYSIYTTVFVICLLVAGTYFFSNDVNRLVIIPIEKMVFLVQKISANPLGVEYKQFGEKEGFIEGMETTILLATITKIGGLMRVGFGEAGANVIARNLNNSGDSGRLNLMGAGTMINSIFGFCDVRQFTDTTECLQEEVMLFVNRIAHILHGIVVQCSGAANKNIGDAFLLTWKVEEKLSQEQVAALADQALVAFLKTLVELSRHQDFICNFSVSATARLYKRFPGYNVRIGAGLHIGWAIEGAIGSDRKIDASYLSPHVSLTEFLESSTKAYGVPLLLSEPFYRLLSPAAAKYVRQVDRIRRSMAEEPMGLFAYDADVNIDWLEVDKRRKLTPKDRLVAATKSLSKSVDDDKKNSNKVTPTFGDVEAPPPSNAGNSSPVIIVPPYTQDVWVEDLDIVELRHRVNDSFRTLWATGIQYYIKGEWQKARDVFDQTLKMTEDKDGPSKFLTEYIDEHNGNAPADWAGYRMEGDGH